MDDLFRRSTQKIGPGRAVTWVFQERRNNSGGLTHDLFRRSTQKVGRGLAVIGGRQAFSASVRGSLAIIAREAAKPRSPFQVQAGGYIWRSGGYIWRSGDLIATFFSIDILNGSQK